MKISNQDVIQSWSQITNKEIDAVVKVLQSRWLTTGYVTQDFSNKISKYIGSKYCLSVSSCTAAIHLALIAAGVKEGDEVITSPLTFVSTVNAILYLKAKPVFVDIKENDFIINEDKIEKYITKKTKAILVVHYAGFSANLDKLRLIVKKHHLELIEDAAHAFGSKYKNEFIGQNSKYCCFSFYPTKNLTSIEGGALITNSKKIFKKASILALHGITKDAWKRFSSAGTWRYDVVDIGYKYNMTNIQAAVGIAQLERIKELYHKREEIYRFYKKELSKIKEIETLTGNDYSKPFRYIFVIKIKSPRISRDQFIEILKKKEILCSVFFIPVYRFSIYKKLFSFNRKNFPETEKAYKECVALPFSAVIKKSEAKKVVRVIKEIFNLSKNV